MKTDNQQYTSSVKSGLETKSTELELSEVVIRKWLNKEYKANLQITNKSLKNVNKFFGFAGLRKYFSLVELEQLLVIAEQKTTDKIRVCMGVGIYVTLYVK